MPARLDVHPDRLLRAIDLEIRLYGNVREVILGLAEHGSNRFRNANNLERPSVDEYFAPDGVYVGKEFGGDILANHCRQRAALIVALGNVSAIRRCNDIDIDHVRGNPAYVAVFERL